MIFRFLLFPRTSFILFVLLFILFTVGFSRAEILELKISDNRVVIKAEEVELETILQAISGETGMQFSFFVIDSSERISCRIDEPSMANTLSVLLKNWNYSIVYRNDRGGRLTPESLLMVSKVSNKPDSTPIKNVGETVINPDSHIQHLQENAFADLFKEDQIRAKQVEEKTVEYSSGQATDNALHLLPGQKGIQITALPPESSFAKIGLHIGDIIYDVNGKPINSVKELVNAMKVSDTQSIIRIERYSDGKNINPIYIELH